MAGHPVAHAVTLTLVLVVAHQRADSGHGVILEQHFTGFVHLVCLQQTDDLRDIGVDGAALLAQGLFAAQAAVGFVQNVKCHDFLLIACGSLIPFLFVVSNIALL